VTVLTRSWAAKRELGAASWTTRAKASSSSKEEVVIVDVGDRVMSIHITIYTKPRAREGAKKKNTLRTLTAADRAGDHAEPIRASIAGQSRHMIPKLRIIRHAERYAAMTEGMKRWLARSFGLSCSACAKYAR
jgi:hypothetical protein